MSLTVITGPMYSGKSSRLIAMCRSYSIAGRPVYIFKPDNDCRYSCTKVVSHNGDKLEAIPIDRESVSIYSCGIDFFTKEPVIAFDEVQFFNSYSITQIITQLLYVEQSTVICAGLSNDSDGKPFGAMPHLLSIADEIISLTAVCSHCKQIAKATRTYRKNGLPSEQVLIGGKDEYEARCFNCWMLEE